MKFSHFPTLKNTLANTHELPWTEFVAKFRDHLEITDKSTAPLISPAEWPSGVTRRKKDVIRVHFAALDLDKISDDVVSATLETLKPYQYFLHTTYSHAASSLNCLRVYLPISRPIAVTQWPRFWSALNTFVGNIMDPACSDAGRVYYVPSMPPGTQDKNHTLVNEGQIIDVDILLTKPEPQKSSLFVSHSMLTEFASRLRQKNSEAQKTLAAQIFKLTKGESFAEPGERDSTLFKICAAFRKKWPQANSEQLASHFEASLRNMQSQSEDAPTISDVLAKLDRLQQETQEREIAMVHRHGDQLEMLIYDAFLGERSTPYTEEEIQGFCKQLNAPKSLLKRRWILQRDTNEFYIFKNGSYGPRVSLGKLPACARRDLAAASTAGVNCYQMNNKGESVAQSAERLIELYATPIDQVDSDMCNQKSYYDWKNNSLMEAPCPMRSLTPEFIPDVDQYLRLLGGKSADKLLDWVAVVTRLDAPCSALFLHGHPGTGKSLLGHGLARIWRTGGATALKETIRDFNQSFIRCPLILADEYIPCITKEDSGSAMLRNYIQETSREVREKHKNSSELKGCARLIIAANNEGVFKWKEHLNGHDIKAIQERILAIEVGEESRGFLASLGERARDFVFQDLLAKHALWLRDNRKVISSSRFLVPGCTSSFHNSIITGNGLNGAIIDWVTCYLKNPGKISSSSQLHIRVYKGQVLVTARLLVEQWETYVTNTETRQVTTSSVSKALRGLSGEKEKIQLLDARGQYTNYWPIQPEYLLHWNKGSGHTTDDEITKMLAVDTVLQKSTTAMFARENA